MNETLPTQTAQSSATPCYLPVPTSFEEAYRIAKVLAASDLVPKDYKGKPENCLVAMQWGADIGMAGLQALQNIAVINGRPSIWGDAAKALVLSHKSCEDIEEYIEGEGNEMVAVCIAKRKGKKPSEQRFSVADAKTAGLWGKQGPWTNYPKRMLQMRARGFSIRDAFPDVLRGLILAEEAQDYTEKDMGAAVVVDDNGKPVPPTTQTPPRKPPTKTNPDATPEQTPAENGGSPIPPEFTDTKKPESTVIDGATGEIVDAEKPPKATPAATTTSANSPMASEGLLKVVRSKIAAANIEESFVLESFNLESLNAANTTLCNEIIKWAAENAQ